MKSNEYMEPCPCCEEQRYYNVKLKPCANGGMGIALSFEKETDKEGLAMVVFQRCMAAGYVDLKFCPYCGKPQTYEAFREILSRQKEWGIRVEIKCRACGEYVGTVGKSGLCGDCEKAMKRLGFDPENYPKMSTLMGKDAVCAYKTKEGICEKHSTENQKEHCLEGPCPDEVRKVADRIRLMNDKTLAHFLSDFQGIAGGMGPWTCLEFINEPATKEWIEEWER